MAKYFFPSSYAITLGQPYNSSESGSPWIMLYPESKWQEAYFYVVSCLHSLRAMFLLQFHLFGGHCRGSARSA